MNLLTAQRLLRMDSGQDAVDELLREAIAERSTAGKPDKREHVPPALP